VVAKCKVTSHPSKLRKFKRIASQLGSRKVVVGWAVELDTPPEVIAIAAINALGGNRGDNPPPRPVLEPMLAANRNTIRGFHTKAAQAAARGRNPELALEQLAAFLGPELQRWVADMHTPPNAPSVIARKGFDDPLRGPSRPSLGVEGDRIWRYASARLVRTRAGL
jgi:hypothetical protein